MLGLPFILISEKVIFRHFLLPTLCFICTYSLLPHKELRFILFVVPILNLCVASGLINFHKKIKLMFKKVETVSNIIFVSIVTVLVLSGFSSSYLMLSIAAENYPGGLAGQFVANDISKSHVDNLKIGVHINNLASQTGFSRFLQLDEVQYSKSIHIPRNLPYGYDLSYVILEPKELVDFCSKDNDSNDCLLLENSRNIGDVNKTSCSFVKTIESYDGFNKIDLKNSFASLSGDLMKKLIKTSKSLYVIRCKTT